MKDRWFDEELSACRLGDARLNNRLHQLVEGLATGAARLPAVLAGESPAEAIHSLASQSYPAAAWGDLMTSHVKPPRPSLRPSCLLVPLTDQTGEALCPPAAPATLPT